MPKYILCRPQGGLNDILCQIEKCCQYADKFNRVVIVDTAYVNSGSFWSPFSGYFISKRENLILDLKNYAPALERGTLFPPALTGLLFSYKTKYQNRSLYLNKANEDVKLTFDFTLDYDEDVLLHHQFGGGVHSLALADRVNLHPTVFYLLVDRLARLPDYFDAVHVRHTDLQSNYETAMQHFKVETSNALFVATDNIKVLEEFRKELGSDRIFSFSKLPNLDGKPLHTKRHKDFDVTSINRDAILDLFTLTFSENLFLGTINKGESKSTSGFSWLAKSLHNDRKIRDQFMRQFDSVV